VNNVHEIKTKRDEKLTNGQRTNMRRHLETLEELQRKRRAVTEERIRELETILARAQAEIDNLRSILGSEE